MADSVALCANGRGAAAERSSTSYRTSGGVRASYDNANRTGGRADRVVGKIAEIVGSVSMNVREVVSQGRATDAA